MTDFVSGMTVDIVEPALEVDVEQTGQVRDFFVKEGLMGPDGRGITSLERTSGTGEPGTTDTYTITYTDDTTSTFTVVNGTNGEMQLIASPVAGRLAQVNAAGQVESSPLDAATVATQIGDLYTAVDTRVVGPASSTDLRIATFSGTTGKLIADGGRTVAGVLNRANHTGTQSADTVIDGTTNKAYTATEKTKLAGVAAAATANSTDAQLRDRSTHTGTQTLATISDAGTAASKNTGTGAGQVPILSGTPGTASASTYLTGAGTWATPAGGAGASAGGGLLASKVYNPSTSTTITFGSAYAALDATNLAVTFTAPASGAVMVNLEGMAFHSAASVVSFWGIYAGTTAVGTRQVLQGVSASHISRTRVGFLVTGLTAGTSYTYQWWGARGGTAGAGLYVGGASSTASTSTNAPVYGLAQMEVWAA